MYYFADTIATITIAVTSMLIGVYIALPIF